MIALACLMMQQRTVASQAQSAWSQLSALEMLALKFSRQLSNSSVHLKLRYCVEQRMVHALLQRPCHCNVIAVLKHKAPVKAI
jgi:hypothetical protein